MPGVGVGGQATGEEGGERPLAKDTHLYQWGCLHQCCVSVCVCVCVWVPGVAESLWRGGVKGTATVSGECGQTKAQLGWLRSAR